MIAITGATGQLGALAVEALLKTVPAKDIVAIVRNPAKAEALTQKGVVVRQGDYNDEAALTAALAGVDKLLLVSSSEVGQRAVQHRNVINAAKAAGVSVGLCSSSNAAAPAVVGELNEVPPDAIVP